MAKGKVQAITSSDALLATQEESKEESIFREIVGQVMPTATDRPSVIFKLKNAPNGKVHVDGIDDVYDPKTEKVRRIRLIRGLGTIWMDEQDKVDKTYLDKNRISLTFIQGNLICDQVKDALIIEAARLMNGNVGNKHRIPGKKREWQEWNPTAQEEEALIREMFEQEVVGLAMNQPLEKVKKHALFLGVRLTDEMGNMRTENGIRALYVREAKKDPKRFKDSMDSKEVELNFLIRRSVVEAKIDVSSANIRWANGGQICRLPHGRQPVEYLIEFGMLPTEESKLFVERLQSLNSN